MSTDADSRRASDVLCRRGARGVSAPSSPSSSWAPPLAGHSGGTPRMRLSMVCGCAFSAPSYGAGGWACEELWTEAGRRWTEAWRRSASEPADRARTGACTRARARASSASGAGAGAQASIARQWSDSSDTDAARPARHTPARAGLL